MNEALPIPTGPRAAPLRLPAARPARGHSTTFVAGDEAALFDLPAEVHHAAEGVRSKARKAPERPRWAQVAGHVLCGPCVVLCHEAGPNWHLVPAPRVGRRWRTDPSSGERVAHCREHEDLQRQVDEQRYGKPGGRK